MNRYKCIIFDFDGTLADTNAGIVRTFQETFRQLGFPVPSVEKITSTIGLSLADGFKAACGDLSDEQMALAVDRYRAIFPGIAFPLITAFPGVLDTLGKIRARGIRMAIATSRSHHSLEKLAEQIGVLRFFDGAYGAEDVVNHKPAPDLVNLILKEFSLQKEDVLVVGDATYDLLMGKGAGCRVCGVSWGNQSREKLQSASPDDIIDRIEDLLSII